MYYVHNRSEVSGAEVRRSESGVQDLEARGVVVRRFEYRFQPSRNRYVTTVERLLSKQEGRLNSGGE